MAPKAPNAPLKFTSPTKPPKSSTMTQDEKDNVFYQIGKMEKKMDEVEKKMENHMENKMLELQNFISSMIL